MLNYDKTDSVCAYLAHTGSDGKEYKVKHYALELILKIGYKIDVDRTIKFSEWANKVIKEISEETSQKWLPIEVFEDGDFKLEVCINPKENTVWLTQEQISKLFTVDRSTITKHIKNILEEEELDESNVKKMHIPFSDKLIHTYNLNMIISIGFRVNSKRATKFRIWANKIIEQHLLKGYTIDESRVTLYKENYIELNNTVLRLEDKVISHDKEITLLKNKFETKELTEENFNELLAMIQAL